MKAKAPKGGVSRQAYNPDARMDGFSRRGMVMLDRDYHPDGRNARTVWEMSTQPYKEAHFATFPKELARRCIAAGSSAGGCCATCGAPRRRVTGEARTVEGRGSGNAARKIAGESDNGRTGTHMGSSIPWSPTARDTAGWAPTCRHEAESVPCVALDPFAGSGTTLEVAAALGRSGWGIELSGKYCEMVRARLARVSVQLSLLG